MEEAQNPVVANQPVAESSVESPKASNKKTVILLSGFVAIAAIILAAAGYLYFRNSKPNYAYNNQYSAQANPSSSVSPSVVNNPSQVSTVSSKTDLDTVLNELNSTTEKDLQNDYSQASTEGNNL